MNTFLPYPDFTKSAACLDDKRLNKQIIEASQMLNGQWPNHPCSKMWKNNHCALKAYSNACLHEWKVVREKKHKFEPYELSEISLPSWFTSPLVFLTHRVNLLKKSPEWYDQFGWDYEYSNLRHFPEGYFWPTGPLGKTGQRDSDAWMLWANQNKGAY